MNARYYDPQRCQFLSQKCGFLASRGSLSERRRSAAFCKSVLLQQRDRHARIATPVLPLHAPRWATCRSRATPTAMQTATLCSGQTPAGSTNWQANGSNGLYLDVNTATCGFTTTPRYLTALSGSNHWTILGVNAIYTPTPTGFRVYVRNNDGSALTPAAANGWGWSLTWRAVNRQYAVVTQSYSFNGQRIAQRKDGVLTYLHADHLGSTLLATDAQGNVVGGNQPRYFAYGRERTPSLAALPTDYTYTGQKQDGSGLVYMNARYYDPQIGQFISSDTEVPDATNLMDYDRYAYARSNPMKYNDPSGHYSAEALMQNFGVNSWEEVTWLFDKRNHDSKYAGMGDWLQVLLRAENGWHISAYNPIAGYETSGVFQRDATTGAINIMVQSDGESVAVPEYAFGIWGAQMGKGGVGRYQLTDRNGRDPMKYIGEVYYMPGPCGTWDCTAIGLDSSSLLLSVGGDSAIGCSVASLGTAAGVCVPAAGVAKGVDSVVTGASVLHTADMLRQGRASRIDMAVSLTTAYWSVQPGTGVVSGILQLVYDFIDPALSPLFPDEKVQK